MLSETCAGMWAPSIAAMPAPTIVLDVKFDLVAKCLLSGEMAELVMAPGSGLLNSW
jgi:hypothetical protein